MDTYPIAADPPLHLVFSCSVVSSFLYCFPCLSFNPNLEPDTFSDFMIFTFFFLLYFSKTSYPATQSIRISSSVKIHAWEMPMVSNLTVTLLRLQSETADCSHDVIQIHMLTHTWGKSLFSTCLPIPKICASWRSIDLFILNILLAFLIVTDWFRFLHFPYLFFLLFYHLHLNGYGLQRLFYVRVIYTSSGSVYIAGSVYITDGVHHFYAFMHHYVTALPSHSGCRCLLFCPALGAFVCCSVTSVAWSLWFWLTYISYGLGNTGPVTFLSDVWLAALTVMFLRNTPSWFAPFCAHLSNTLTC